MTDELQPPAAGPRRPTRKDVSAGSFWLIVPGVLGVAAGCFEGSAVWAAFILASAYLGFSGGWAGGDALLAAVRAGAERGEKPSGGAVARSVIGLRTVLLFWVPQIFFLLVSLDLAQSLGPEAAPRSLKDGKVLVWFECLATYFVTIGAAWYKTWQWRRTLPAA